MRQITQLEKQSLIHEQGAENLPTGVSIESASYIENSNENFTNIETTDNGRLDTGDQEEYTPKLFSDETCGYLRCYVDGHCPTSGRP